MPPSVVMPTCGRVDRLNNSLKSLEFNRKELLEPWEVNRPSFDDRRLKTKNAKLDPPAMSDNRRERSMKGAKVQATPSKPDPIAKSEATRKLTKSRVHPSIAQVSEDPPPSSSRKSRETNNLYRRVRAESQKIVKETSKKLSRGLYEEFPMIRRPSSKSDEHNQSSLSCSVGRDEFGLFVEEVDWKNTSGNDLL